MDNHFIIRKSIIILFIIHLTALLSSCEAIYPADNTANVQTSISSTTNPVPISEQEAIQMITDRIGTNNGTRIIEVDDSKVINDHEYYMIHAYSLGKPMGDEGIQVSYTFGWYYVDKFSRQIFQMDAGGNYVPLE